MVIENGLKELWIPDDKDLDQKMRNGAKSNIYMSPDFLPDFKG